MARPPALTSSRTAGTTPAVRAPATTSRHMLAAVTR